MAIFTTVQLCQPSDCSGVKIADDNRCINNRGRIYGFKLGYEGTNLFDESYRGIKKQRREIDPKSTNSSVQDFWRQRRWLWIHPLTSNSVEVYWSGKFLSWSLASSFTRTNPSHIPHRKTQVRLDDGIPKGFRGYESHRRSGRSHALSRSQPPCRDFTGEIVNKNTRMNYSRQDNHQDRWKLD